MKRILTIILLLIILWVGNGYFFYFKYLQYAIQRNIRKQIESEQIIKQYFVIIEVDEETKIKWIRKDFEFTYNGVMYDVVKVQKTATGKKYYCIQDVKEQYLVFQYLKNNRKQRELLLRFQKVLMQKYFSKPFLLDKLESVTKITYLKYEKQYKSLILSVQSPPPKDSNKKYNWA